MIGNFRPLNSILCVSTSFCVLILSAVWRNLLALILQQFYLLAFVVKVCWLFSCLVATVDVLLSTAILVFRQPCGFSYLQQSSNWSLPEKAVFGFLFTT